jgi:adenine-specific DNA-methyltransferase
MPTLNWIGKEAVINHHLDVPFHLLKDVPDLGCGDPGSGNLIVEGDNLLALKALLPYYKGKVKCICIDPPYNTGTENWAYNDNVTSPIMQKWLKEAMDGKTIGGDEETLDRHDRWLCMMYPRLMLLRDFMTEDGSIFVCLDDNAVPFIRMLMNEVFGAQNFVEQMIWKKSYGGGAKEKFIVRQHEYIVMYARDKKKLPVLWLPPDENAEERYYKFKDERHSERGPYRIKPLEATKSMDRRENLVFPIPTPDGSELMPKRQWWWSKDRVMTALANDELVFTKTKGWSVSYKQYLRNEEGEQRGAKPFSIVDGIYGQQGTAEVRELFDDRVIFQFPKPPSLIERILEISTNPGDLVLDSFAGSGTTGHAVLKMNAAQAASSLAPTGGEGRGEGEFANTKDAETSSDALAPHLTSPLGGEGPEPRRFILVEMEPKIAPDITRERVKRVADGYTNAKGEKVPGLGGGFRYVRLGDAVFDEHGRIRESVRFADLARHVYFTETGEPLPKERVSTKTPLLGIHRGRAVYLLFNGILKDRSIDGGNALCRETLAVIQEHNAAYSGIEQTVVHGTSERLSKARQKREGIVFKQIPYSIRDR